MKLTESYLRSLIKQALNEQNDIQARLNDLRYLYDDEDTNKIGKYTYIRTLLRRNPNITDEEILNLIEKGEHLEPFNHAL